MPGRSSAAARRLEELSVEDCLEPLERSLLRLGPTRLRDRRAGPRVAIPASSITRRRVA